MSRVNNRGWTPTESDPRWNDEDYYDSIKPTLDGLAQLWSALHHEDEQEGFREQSNYENTLRDYDYDPEDEYTFKAYEAMKHTKNELRRVQLEHIESELETHGARMMRPYEHHNEDEAYYAYMERDRY